MGLEWGFSHGHTIAGMFSCYRAPRSCWLVLTSTVPATAGHRLGNTTGEWLFPVLAFTQPQCAGAEAFAVRMGAALCRFASGLANSPWPILFINKD